MYAVVILCAIIFPTNGKICHTVEIPMCRVQEYNTRIDLIGLQDLAKDVLHHFEHLIMLNCSHFTRLFVCFAHLPLCANDAQFSSVFHAVLFVLTFILIASTSITALICPGHNTLTAANFQSHHQYVSKSTKLFLTSSGITNQLKLKEKLLLLRKMRWFKDGRF